MPMFSRDAVLYPRQMSMQGLLAPFFLGIVVNYLLWGIQITQSYYYYKTYRKTDRMWLKVAVGLLFFVDLVQSICASETAWNTLVSAWGDPSKLEHLGWGLDALPFPDSLTASIVHFFYAQKIWTLLGHPYNYIWTVVVVTLSCLQLTAGFGCTVFMLATDITHSEVFRIKTWISIWLITASVTDIIITLLMSVKLSKSRTGFDDTNDIISKLIRLTVETGLATSVVQILDIVLYLVAPVTAYHIFLTFVSAKVYSNSMMALLNSRKPRDPSRWDSQGKPIENLRIQTFQSVIVTRDYEMEDARMPEFKPDQSQS